MENSSNTGDDLGRERSDAIPHPMPRQHALPQSDEMEMPFRARTGRADPCAPIAVVHFGVTPVEQIVDIDVFSLERVLRVPPRPPRRPQCEYAVRYLVRDSLMSFSSSRLSCNVLRGPSASSMDS